eukprot:530667-Prorocentrum_lima.AAC.1
MRARKSDIRHTRHPTDCKFSDLQSVDWPCPDCQGNHRRAHASHTYRPGECKWFDEDEDLQGHER